LGSASRVHFLDLADPENPQEIASFAGGKVTTWRDMKTYQDRAYAICDGANEGLMIFDLSGLPDTVTKTYHSQEFFSRAHNIFVDNGRLYVAGANTQYNGMIVLDIASDPDNPALLSSANLSPGGYVHDVFVKEDTAYCSHGYNGFYIWDFGDPSSPVPLASTDSPGYNHSSWPTPSGEYAVFAEEVPTGLPLTVVDLSELAQGNIEKVKTFKEPLLEPAHIDNTPHNPFFRGNYLICSYYEDGLQIFDLSDPLNPERVAYYDTHPDNTDYNGYFGCWGVYPFLPSQLILASDINGGLFVLRADSLDLDSISPPGLPVPVVQSSEGDTLCGGGSVWLFTDLEADHYNWYKGDSLISGADSSAIEVSSTGDYRLIAEKGICSQASEPFALVVQEAPDFSDLPGAVFLCPGESVLFEAPPGAEAYRWYWNGELISENASFEAGEAGLYQLETGVGACVFSSGEISVSLSDGPNVQLDYLPGMCKGESQVLEGPAGMLSYEWYLDGQLLPETDSAIVVMEEGAYSVSFTLPSDGCTFSSDTVEIELYPLPEATIEGAGIPFCPDESGWLFIAEDSLALSYGWENDLGETFPDSNEVEVVSVGAYRVEVISVDGCIARDTFEVQVFETFPPVISLAGDSLYSSPGEAYQWYLDGEVISGATDPTFVPPQTGSYQVRVWDENGCETISEELFFTITSLKDKEQEAPHSLRVYPNPAGEHLFIEAKAGSSFQIIDPLGRIFHSGVISAQRQKVSLEGLARGLYWLKVDRVPILFIKK
jgi:choice-of-anchor B domain-containing protein